MRRLVFGALLLLVASPGRARDLYWQSIDVHARLDKSGTLHVVERQRYVFNGDWNGGERRFRVAEGQSLRFIGLRRIEDSGTAVPLSQGDLSRVDQYRMEGEVLRWRSRLPTDPSFENKVLTYEIAYELADILFALRGGPGKRYLLNHDFAFPDRPGMIQQFRVDLEVDPEWRLIDDLPARITAQNLVSGESVIVRRELEFVGANAPRASYEAPAPWSRFLTIALIVAGIPVLFFRFYLGERARGRFARPDESIDHAWLERHILSELPEVVGYMYDNASGPPEVAAVLARMTQQGIITSRVVPRRFRAPLLEMTFHPADRDMTTQEQKLVHLFFIDRRKPNETDTDRVRKYYRTRGFNPGESIENALAAQAARNRAWTDETAPGNERQQKRTVAFAFGLLIAGCFFGFPSFWLMLYMAVLGGIACALGRFLATRSAERLSGLGVRWFAAAVPTLLAGWLLTSIARRDVSRVRELPLLLAAAFVLTVYSFVMSGARSKASREKLLLRSRISMARDWFRKQLRQRNPELRDEWMPYLLALGLGRNVERWFSAFGGAVVASGGYASSSAYDSPSFGSASASSGGAATAWSGGGGSFGGAGATGSWAAAATMLGSGASAPASHSSDGGSSGGGSYDSGSSGDSSSGGGGGGGW
jgi:uncharacterized membrane protein YgcG